MGYGILEIVGGVAGAALCSVAVFVLNPDAVSRATEAILDRVEVGLARRQQRRRARAARAGVASEGFPLFESWQQRSG
ncbi:MAG TPA: hypothetical protein VEY09_00575 [Pyrinomonadaceae bacterium]|nr:hypothetical protein [Pyrinomonadaceae bacterium]